MKILLLKCVLIIGVLITITQADCPISEHPTKIIDCLRYFTSAVWGAARQNLNIICTVAADIANCAKRELGDCVAEKIGRATLDEISNMADNCCPERNNARCSIRDSSLTVQRCFAADSLVTLADGNQKSIAHLQAGDAVLAYNDETKQVISTHLLTMLDFQPHQFALFKQVTTITGRQLSVTSSHLLPTDIHGYVMAKNIRVGMNIYIMNGNGVLITETVSNVSDVVKQGYIAPLTEEGTLIVNNVAASCYATINSHYVGHAILAPMRWWYSMFGISKDSNKVIGVHWFAKMLYEMTTFLIPSIIHQ
jgi:hypothetical protein